MSEAADVLGLTLVFCSMGACGAGLSALARWRARRRFRRWARRKRRAPLRGRGPAQRRRKRHASGGNRRHAGEIGRQKDTHVCPQGGAAYGGQGVKEEKTMTRQRGRSTPGQKRRRERHWDYKALRGMGDGQRLAEVLVRLPVRCWERGTVGLKYITDFYNDVSPVRARLSCAGMAAALRELDLRVVRGGLGPGTVALMLDEDAEAFMAQWRAS